jgi:ArsR family transcriptional regulator
MDQELVELFKSLSDDTRLKILRLLLKNSEMSCQELSEHFNLSQPTLSHHFKKLVDAHIVEERKESIWRFYKINKKFLKAKGIQLQHILH